MKNEELVASKNLSKALKDEGVPQKNATFMWLNNTKADDPEERGWTVVKRTSRMDKYPFPDAYLPSELAHMIPDSFEVSKEDFSDGYTASWFMRRDDGYTEHKSCEGETMVEALGKLVLWLIRNDKLEFDTDE